MIYAITRQLLKLFNLFFYSKVEVYGKENIDQSKPTIFAANHQGTFIDGMLVGVYGRTASFLTRADVFNVALLRPILNAYKLIPIYRQRDGGDTVKRNESVFRGCFDMLEKNGAFMIFPEASHDNRQHLRPFKKGLARISFGAEKFNNWELDVNIIPTSIHYEKHRYVRRAAYVTFGEPILVKDYKKMYEENENAALNNLTNDVKNEILKNMLHIHDFENHDALHLYLDMLRNDEKLNTENFLQKVKSMQVYCDKIEATKSNEDKYFSFIEKLNNYQNLLGKHNLKDKIFSKTYNLAVNFFALIAFLPLWIISFLNSFPLYCIANYLNKGIFKGDYHWFGTAKYIVGFFIAPILQIIIAGVIYSFTKNALLAFLYIPLSCFLVLIWYNYNLIFSKTKAQLKFNKLKKSGELQKLEDLRNEIMATNF